jgi:glycosylphosphatidylinositol transamidase (GPIT) subunit GPI8
MSFSEVTEEMVLALLNLENLDKQATLNYSELFNLVNPEKCLSTYGIRTTLLNE